jgi:hypothetical protein
MIYGSGGSERSLEGLESLKMSWAGERNLLRSH